MNFLIRSLTILFVSLSLVSHACTAFMYKVNGKIYTGRNYDWSIGDHLVVVNPKGKAKFSMENKGKDLKWVSSYGSITFNQFGVELPNGGMNEAGLVMAVLWLNNSKYELKDNRKELNELQFIQYQLDNSSSVSEVINSLQKVRVTGERADIHYFISDAKGNAAVIEFVNGKAIVNKGINCFGITNSTYASSNAFLKGNIYTRSNSLTRYKEIFDQYSETKNNSKVTLKNTSSRGTQYSIVFNQTDKVIEYKLKGEEYQIIKMNDYNYSCTNGYLTFAKGNTKETTQKDNYNLINKVYSKIPFLKDISEEFKQMVATLPWGFTCK